MQKDYTTCFHKTVLVSKQKGDLPTRRTYVISYVCSGFFGVEVFHKHVITRCRADVQSCFPLRLMLTTINVCHRAVLNMDMCSGKTKVLRCIFLSCQMFMQPYDDRHCSLYSDNGVGRHLQAPMTSKTLNIEVTKD